jgi:alginate O-acetyltransferase complex protein AlgJ
MRFFCLVMLVLCGSASAIVANGSELSQSEQHFRSELSTKVAALEKKNVSAMSGADGWLFLTSELRFLAQGKFWGDAAAKASRGRKPEWADPIPAIVDFHRQLHERGIELLLVPVPAKAAMYPDKLGLEASLGAASTAPYLQEFYKELRARDVQVLDLSTTFAQPPEGSRGPVYCKTDSHFSGLGCVLAAGAIAEHIRAKLPAPASRKDYSAEWKDVAISGDLPALLPRDVSKPEPEKIWVRVVSEKGNGVAVQPDANSPLLVIGDSHTLVFHDFLAEKSGLIDQLAHELGFAPDLIGTRGSGATAVRISLYRKAKSDPGYLAKKKLVVWCFAAREFTETDQGWVVQPIAK